MRFLLDERAEARIAAFLTRHGHDATRIGRDYPASLPDTVVLALAHREQQILITNDKDFGELVVREHHPHVGVILFWCPPPAGPARTVTAGFPTPAPSPLFCRIEFLHTGSPLRYSRP